MKHAKVKEIRAYIHKGDTQSDALLDPWVNTASPETWREHPCYYVSATDGGHLFWLLLGPFRRHKDALDRVEQVKTLAMGADPRAHFYGFGTVKVKNGKRDGRANQALGWDMEKEAAK